ncbi:MAG TPA: CHAT domain-containing protein, partial [Gemmataceae bacterium]|nr:CHAT domain-containing protein [Gemmataceae bacterium]
SQPAAGPQPSASEESESLPQPRSLQESTGTTLPLFEPLASTRKEATHLAGLLGVTPWLGAEVEKSRFLECASPRQLHLSTQSFVQIARQLESSKSPGPVGPRMLPASENPLSLVGLAMAGANKDEARATQAVLTAKEISGLDLTGTDLAVLSTASFAPADDHNGRAVMGLERSFILAGAQTLVTSLWRLPDQPRLQLLQEFYRRILDGEPRAEALRSAKLMVKSKYPQALHWAAFVCLGNYGPLLQAPAKPR